MIQGANDSTDTLSTILGRTNRSVLKLRQQIASSIPKAHQNITFPHHHPVQDMNENFTSAVTSNLQSDFLGHNLDGRPPHSTMAQQVPGLPHGRRVTLGGDRRRSSLGMAEATLGDLFGRRASGFGDGRRFSGFGDRRPSGFGDIDFALTRRDSLDSTTAVLDAAIMDITRRRLSMAMGGMPNDGPSLNDQLSSVNQMASLGGMNLNGVGGQLNVAGQLSSSLGNQTSTQTMMPSSQASVSAIASRQKQLQEQQRELERRQQELETQRQQLLAAMEERRRAMQQMQQKLQLPPGSIPAQRNPLGVFGGNQSLLMGLQGSTNLGSRTTASQGNNNNAQPWIVCKFCHSKAFSNREEAAQHELICTNAQSRRNSIGNMRRSSLDLLVGTLDARPDLTRVGQLGNTGAMQLKQARRDSDLGLIDRRFSISADHSNPGLALEPTTKMSNGPFAMMEYPLPLAMPPDKDWLTPLHCFVRRHCVEIFTATDKDVATPSKGKRKPIQVGQVGIRCPHCHQDESSRARERGSVYYPTSIASIYNATMNLLQRHLHGCSSVPQDIMRRYETLKADDARSGTSKKYWVESALSLGLVDTPNGIRFSGSVPPPLPNADTRQNSDDADGVARRNSNDFFPSSKSEHEANDSSKHSTGKGNVKAEDTSQRPEETSDNSDSAEKSASTDAEQNLAATVKLVLPEDEPYATGFSFHLLKQMQPCVFTEADRLGKRKGLPPGFPGLACRHCFGGYGSGRFFPSSIKTLSDTSKTLNVLHNHMMRCRKCPQDIRDNLDTLRKTHDGERAKMKFGSQKAFFARIWDRLHYKDPSVNSKRKFQPSLSQKAAVAPSGAKGNQGIAFPQGGMDASFLQGSGVFDSMPMQQFAGDLMEPKRRKT